MSARLETSLVNNDKGKTPSNRRFAAADRQASTDSGKGKKKSPRTPEHTEKLRQINLNREYAPQTDEHKEKLRQAHLGKPKSKESIEKMKQTNLRKFLQKKANILHSIIDSLISFKEKS